MFHHFWPIKVLTVFSNTHTLKIAVLRLVFRLFSSLTSSFKHCCRCFCCFRSWQIFDVIPCGQQITRRAVKHHYKFKHVFGKIRIGKLLVCFFSFTWTVFVSCDNSVLCCFVSRGESLFGAEWVCSVSAPARHSGTSVCKICIHILSIQKVSLGLSRSRACC